MNPQRGRKRLAILSITMVLAWAVVRAPTYAWAGTSPAAPQKIKAEPEISRPEVFGLTRVHALHFELSAKEWQTLQKAGQRGSGGGFLSRLSQMLGNAKQPPGEAEVHRSGGMEFPWAHADLTAEGNTYRNVGLRYKGNFTFMISARLLKRSMKIELDHYDPQAPTFHGLKVFNLHTGIMDPTKVREALSYAVFRAAGVAAPRTAFAEVTLTVPGKYDREYVGLFTLTEQVGRQFLQDRFGSDQGLLMKPLLRGPEYLGESWSRYQDRYQPQREPSADEARRVIEFAQLVNNAADDLFRKEIGAYLDVDAFLRFLAVSAFLVNLDSPLAMPQNYYLYLHPQSRKFIFLPWDLDLSLAAWPFGGAPEDQMNLSLLHPHIGKHTLIDRMLGIPEVKAQYLKLLKELAVTCFAPEQLLAQIQAIEEATKTPLAKEAKAVAARREGGHGFGSGPPRELMRAPEPRTFVEKRTESIQAQLAGKSQGYIPRGGLGFGPAN